MLEGEPCGLGVGLVADERVALAAASPAKPRDRRPAAEGRGDGAGEVGAPCSADGCGVHVADVLAVPALAQLGVGDVVPGDEALGGERRLDGLRLGAAVLDGVLEQGLDSVDDGLALGGIAHDSPLFSRSDGPRLP